MPLQCHQHLGQAVVKQFPIEKMVLIMASATPETPIPGAGS